MKLPVSLLIAREKSSPQISGSLRKFFFTIIAARTSMTSLWGLLVKELETLRVDTPWEKDKESDIVVDPDFLELGRYKRLGLMVTFMSKRSGSVAVFYKVMLELV